MENATQLPLSLLVDVVIAVWEVHGPYRRQLELKQFKCCNEFARGTELAILGAPTFSQHPLSTMSGHGPNCRLQSRGPLHRQVETRQRRVPVRNELPEKTDVIYGMKLPRYDATGVRGHGVVKSEIRAILCIQ